MGGKTSSSITAEGAQGKLSSGLRTEDSPGVRLLGLTGAALSAAVIIAGLVLMPGARERVDSSLIVWAAMACLAGFATINLGAGRPTLTMEMPVLLACSFVHGPLPAALVAFVGAYDRTEAQGRSRWPRILCNHAQTSMSVLVAGTVFQFLGDIEQGVLVCLPATLAAVVADAMINYPSVAFVTSVAGHGSFVSVLRQMRVGSPRFFVATYGALGLMALLIATVYHHQGFVGLALFAGPLLLVREALFQRLRFDIAQSRLEAQELVLRNVDERIADERRDERMQIAGALHDDVLQSLYNVTIRAQVIREDYRAGRLLDLEEDVPALVEAAEKAASDLRDVIQGLRKSPIGRAGLIEAITLMARHLQEESGIKFVLDLDSELKGSPKSEMVGYQIVREAMTNAIRHSKGDTVWVSVCRRGDQLHLYIQDNGVGFDPARPPDGLHFGLALMRERARLAGGDLEIRGTPGAGACVEGWLPLRA